MNLLKTYLTVVLLLTSLFAIPHTEAAVQYAFHVEGGSINLDVSPGSTNNSKCFNVVAANDENEEITIDIYPDITASLKNLEGFSFLPSSFSANLTSGERKEIPFCISFPTGTEATQGSVTFFSTATKNDGERTHKNAGQPIFIRFFADLSVSSAKSKYEYCQSTNANTNFTISDAGNGIGRYAGEVGFGVNNGHMLEERDFLISFSEGTQILKIGKDSPRTISMDVSLPDYEPSGNNSYFVELYAGSIEQGQSNSNSTTVIFKVLECSIIDEILKSPFFVVTLGIISIGLLVIFRRSMTTTL